MRSLFLTSFIILSLLSSSLHSQNKIIKLSGSIDDQYPISMTLNVKSEEVVGYYYYEKYQSNILLTGELEGGSLILRESPDVDSDFEKGFKGELKDGNLIGSWFDTNRDQKLGFYAYIDSEIKADTAGEWKEIIGEYTSDRNSDNFRGSATIKFIADNIFYFEINTATRGGCIGDIQNVIELKNFQKGTFSDKLCKELNLDLESGKLVVTQSFKCLYHGFTGCEFQGSYTKN